MCDSLAVPFTPGRTARGRTPGATDCCAEGFESLTTEARRITHIELFTPSYINVCSYLHTLVFILSTHPLYLT